jgi:AcrR family transcriptional regulator
LNKPTRSRKLAPVAPSSSRPRIAHRRAQRQDRILAVAARLFAARGFAAVRLEDIADEAQLARATFYTHFRSKAALTAAVVRPALQEAIAAFLRVARRPPREAVDGLLATFVVLWHHHRDALRVAHRMEGKPSRGSLPLHDKLMKVVLRVFERAARARLLRAGDPVLAARMLALLAVPVLELTQSASPDGALFIRSMAGLLLEEHAKPVVGGRRTRGEA